MPQKSYILSLDQGTTSSRALLIGETGQIVGMAQEEFKQIYPKQGWVEHNPNHLLQSQLNVMHQVLTDHRITPGQIKAIGIANQRETTIVWNKETGKAIYNAIVWQDTRTSKSCEALKNKGLEKYIKKNTGLVIDPYFSGTKIKWILDNVENARKLAHEGKLIFGTVDTYLIWHLTEGKQHLTDYSNASRTMLFNIKTLKWDQKLLQELNIPAAMLPEVRPSGSHFGDHSYKGTSIPIMAAIGDQQAALFGQGCFESGDAKITFGTGCFMLMNAGTEPVYSKNGLITTLSWSVDNKPVYVFEGSIFVAGAAVQWLRDGLNFFASAEESEELAAQAGSDTPVYVVPAFAGLGAPHWDMYARGAIFGLTRDTGKDHITRATLESLAYQTKDIVGAMQQDAGKKITALQVDGGASANNLLMQFLADMLNTEVHRPAIIESTAIGAAQVAGLSSGFWTFEEIKEQNMLAAFKPSMKKKERKRKYRGWKKAVKLVRKWK